MSAHATIIDWIEAKGHEPLELGEPSKTWIDRMWHAAIDPDVTKRAFARLDDRFMEYLDGLGADERAATTAAHMSLMEMLLDDRWPLCSCCGSPLCPHCGGGHVRGALGDTA